MPTEDADVSLAVAWTGFDAVVAMTSDPSDPTALYVADQTGQVYRCQGKRKTLICDLSSHMLRLEKDYEERGLLGLALSEDGRAYVFYSTNKKAKSPAIYVNAVARLDLSAGTLEDLFTIDCYEKYHNSGNLVFGPDHMLYVTVGDGGPQKDPENRGQRLDTLHGKVLRIDVSGETGYSIPKDNPFNRIRGARPEIWAYGLRNPWGTAFSDDGRLFLADVGMDSYEEVDIIVKGGNYGWNLYEGLHRTPWTKDVRGLPKTIPPIYEYSHAECGERAEEKGMCSIIGGCYLDGVGYVFGELAGYIRVIRKVSGKWKLVLDWPIPDAQAFVKAIGRGPGNTVFVSTGPTIGPGKGDSIVSELVFQDV